ncbi:hypothetical protein GTU73_08780 [Rathayibacter sp. VKM Ac-2804]|uniref:hypothetical protein n=1 Tax=Rathayibacter sp. VKM Ac-2804 TaxID=2609257 RepID=UPI00132E922A|nr:hypothetical protein [Rathayibacter sp. VKM Ac-2804]QHF24095.1 hypothetical protein GTU73_08780 [Rathayibacter sp. VKM Ac-2804]
MQYDDLDKSELLRRLEKLERLVTQAPIGFSSVTNGALRILSDEGLIVGEAEGENAGKGSQKVYGTIEVTGTLRGDGSIDWEGPVQLKGQVDVTGRMRVQGGGRVVASDAGDNGHSMQLYYQDGVGKVFAFGVPMEIRAWSSVIQLNERGLIISGGGGVIGMSEDSIEIVGPDGSAGAWIELKGGDVFVHNLPDS